MPSADEAGAERGDGEDREADDVGALAAVEVRQPPGREDEHGRGDHVGEDHPDELQQRRVEAALEVGQRDDQRARVDGREQHAEARDRQRPPLVVLVVGGDADAAPGGEGLLLEAPSDVNVSLPGRRSRASSGRCARAGGATLGSVTRRPTVPLLVALAVRPRVRGDRRCSRSRRAGVHDRDAAMLHGFVALDRPRSTTRSSVLAHLADPLPYAAAGLALALVALMRGLPWRAGTVVALLVVTGASTQIVKHLLAQPRFEAWLGGDQIGAGVVAQRPLDRGDDARAVRRARRAARAARPGRRGARRRVRGGRRLRASSSSAGTSRPTSSAGS